MSSPSSTALAHPQLEVRDLRKHYDDGRIEALRGVSLTIAAGEYIAISGSSGSGKSTLLQLLGGLDIATSGQVLYEGAALGSAVHLDEYRARRIGFIFQAFYLLPTLTALENVQVPMLALNVDARTRAARAKELLQEMNLEHRLHQYPGTLSAGERQRVAIARALANNPAILLADEPTGNLDSVNSARIMEILTGIQKRHGMTLIIVTHENDIAHAAPRHIRIRDGKVAE
jgi:ABC-type lipoprotein export system ATPase subunit